MIVTIDKSELPAVQYACGLLDYNVREFTNEVNNKLIQVEITDTGGDEISVVMAWLLRGQVEVKLQADFFSKKY